MKISNRQTLPKRELTEKHQIKTHEKDAKTQKDSGSRPSANTDHSDK